MNPISAFAVTPRSARAFHALMAASALAMACLCSAPVLAQAPAATPVVTAPAPVGNVAAPDNAAQAMSPALGGTGANSAAANPYGLRVA